MTAASNSIGTASNPPDVESSSKVFRHKSLVNF
jgi:hypothetical protein